VIFGVFEPLRWLFITPPRRRKGAKIHKGSSGADRAVQAVLTGVKCIAPFLNSQNANTLCETFSVKDYREALSKLEWSFKLRLADCRLGNEEISSPTSSVRNSSRATIVRERDRRE